MLEATNTKKRAFYLKYAGVLHNFRAICKSLSYAELVRHNSAPMIYRFGCELVAFLHLQRQVCARRCGRDIFNVLEILVILL